MEIDNKEIITDGMQSFDFDVISHELFYLFREYLEDLFEKRTINKKDVIEQINHVVNRLGGVEKVLINKGYL